MAGAGDTVIRLARAEDAPAIAAIYAPIVTASAISFEEVAPSAEVIAGRIAATLGPYPYLVAERDGSVAGYAYASAYRPRAAYRWSVEVTVYVAGSAHRKGTGRALYGALLAILSAQGFRMAFAGITLPNPGSVGLHESFGFRHTGTDPRAGYKLDRWWDVGRWALEIQALDDRPAEAQPLGNLPGELMARLLAGSLGR